MKMTVGFLSAVAAAGLMGCTQHASTVPVAERPASPAATTTNTFGESAEETVSNAARAREANYGSGSSSK